MSWSGGARVLLAVGAIVACLGACESEALETNADCQSDDDCAGASSCNAGKCGSPTTDAYGDSACGRCVQQGCDSEFAECDADASCGAYLACLLDCPFEDGSVEATCVARCPASEGAAAASAQQAYDACRSTAAAQCGACGGPGTPGGAGAGPGGAGGTGSVDEVCSGNPAVNQSCAEEPEPTTCIDCFFSRCCESVAASSATGPETELFNCWLECATPECEDECYATYPDPAGILLFGAYDACMTVNCFGTDACPLRAAGMAGGVSPCTKCLGAKCTCELTECATDVDCHLIRQCMGTCDSDAACGEACVSAYPAGQAKLELLMVCTAQNCIEDC